MGGGVLDGVRTIAGASVNLEKFSCVGAGWLAPVLLSTQAESAGSRNMRRINILLM